MKRAHIIVVAAVAAALLTTGTLTATATDTPPPPPQPEWVTTDGTVDETMLPSQMPVIGPDGEALVDSSGNPVMVDPRTVEPDYYPDPRCPRCPAEPPPSPDDGDQHSVATDEEGNTEEIIDVGDDTITVP
ncbi:hypothetical protein [Streptomyces sp. NPDC018833]|uniref:hypothetical protein n=1 Tax=Streptomyces sp. NPDC018833 TaxID=3365053 RepID=UPI0037B75DDE